jgi:hypothetical protein
MIYTLYVTNPNDLAWSTIATIESDNLTNAISFFHSHNDGLVAVEYNPLLDSTLIFGLKEQVVTTIQTLLDNTARSRGYDDIVSLCTYANSTIPKFKAEGQAGVDWRDACWAKCYQIMSEVQGGTRSIPTPEEILSELPNIIW